MNWLEFKDSVDTVTDMFGEHEPSDTTWDALLTKIELLDDKLKRIGEHVDEGLDTVSKLL